MAHCETLIVSVAELDPISSGLSRIIFAGWAITTGLAERVVFVGWRRDKDESGAERYAGKFLELYPNTNPRYSLSNPAVTARPVTYQR